MIAIDTNIIVRLLVQDDPVRFQSSKKLFEHGQIFVADTVILETEWVLRFAYDYTPDQVCGFLRKLFGLPNVHVANPALLAHAINWHEKGLDFADAFHLALSQQHACLKSFDAQFIKRSKGLSACVVEKPD